MTAYAELRLDGVPDAAAFWQAPVPARPGIVFLLATAAAQNSLQRILKALLAGRYRIEQPEAALLHYGCPREQFEADIAAPPPGTLALWWYCTPMLHARLNGAAQTGIRCLASMRDPRDSLCSLYHLMFDDKHTPPSSMTAYRAAYIEEQQRVRAMSIDQFVMYRADDWLRWCEGAYAFADSLPQGATVLSYAQLCEDFPAFLDRLITAIDIPVAAPLRDHLLATEDIQRPATLNAGSYARSRSASPRPGRHKGELQPATIAWINERSRALRAWMAAHDPAYAHCYDD